MGCSLSSTATSTVNMSSTGASSTAASGPPPLRVLLITHNVCGIFDDTSGAARAMWVAEIAALAAEHDADFVALHMQETGGSDWRTNALEGVAPLAAALAAACPEYWSSGVLCNTDTSDESRFTALSCCFLVRRRALPRVRLWHFGDGGRAAGFVTLEDEAAPALAAAALPAQLCRHQRFPQDFFPEFPTWSRKGHLHTRWQLGDVRPRNSAIPRTQCSLRAPAADGSPRPSSQASFDLVNFHNFHDQDNFVSLQRDEEGDGATLSAYARARSRALAHTARSVAAEATGEKGAAPALFVFGDFNFRLTLPAVVAHLAGDDGLRAARDAELRRVAEGGLLKIPLTAPPPAPARASSPAASSSGPFHLEIGPKRFTSPRLAETVRAQLGAWRNFDDELAAYCAGNSNPLMELPVDFVPSYMYVAIGKPAPKSDEPGTPAAAHAFGAKRCPGWCDRVLLDAAALSAVRASAVAAVYGSQEQKDQIIPDHNKVYLAFAVA